MRGLDVYPCIHMSVHLCMCGPHSLVPRVLSVRKSKRDWVSQEMVDALTPLTFIFISSSSCQHCWTGGLAIHSFITCSLLNKPMINTKMVCFFICLLFLFSSLFFFYLLLFSWEDRDIGLGIACFCQFFFFFPFLATFILPLAIIPYFSLSKICGQSFPMHDFVLRLFASILLALSSVLGALAPFCFLRQSREEVAGVCRTRVYLHSDAMRSLSMANCFSAGMLITLALAHFLPSAILELTKSTPGDAFSPVAVSAAVLLGVLVPAVMERGSYHTHGHSHDGHIHTHGVCAEHEKQRRFSLLVVLLMCFHATTEGVLLGVETSVTLMSVVLPLVIHRIFDGVIVGVVLAKELCIELDTEGEMLPLTNNGDAVRNAKGMEWYRFLTKLFCRGSILLWLCLAPLATVASALLMKGDNTGNMEADGPNRAPHIPCHGNNGADKKSFISGTVWMAGTKGMGSGFFLFAGLMMLLQEELRGARAVVSLLTGVVLTLLLSMVEA